MGIGGVTTPTALLHLAAGTNVASKAPLKFTSGTNTITAEAGTVEYNGSAFLATPSGTSRYQIAMVLTGSATLDFPLTAPATGSDLTITVTGAAVGDVVSVGTPNGSVNANTAVFAWVSAADTVTVRYINYGIAGIDPASGVFNVTVTKN